MTPVLIGVDYGDPAGDVGVVQIGPHRLYQADAYALRPRLGFFDAEVMDPPYKFRASGGGAFRKTRNYLEMIVSDGLDQGFDHTIINPLLCGSVIVFSHNDQLPVLLPYLNGLFHRFALCTVIKKNPVPMRNKHYLPDLELYTHAWNHGFHPIGDHHDMHRHVSSYTYRANLRGLKHGTVKADNVMMKILRNVQGNTVIDPFMGTGSTGVAAIRTGKVFTGIEKNPDHFLTAVDRIAAAYQAAQGN